MNKFIIISMIVATAAVSPKAFGQDTGEIAAVTAPTSTVAAAAVAATTTNEPTIVTSDRSQLDYLKKVWVFEGNVLVADPRITIRANKIDVYFGGGGTNQSNSIQRAIAEGDVVITQDDKKSTSDRAEYTAEDGKVVLTGNPRVHNPDGVVTGTRITFWRGQEKMDIESDTNAAPTRLIIYPEEQKKKPQPQEQPQQ